MNYLAHSANKQGDTHLAKEHLANSARLATEFAGKSSWSEEATLAGLLHDLGKYADLFQARLRGEASGLDHWSAGAWVALSEYQAVAAALAIQGHHIGLQHGDIQSLRKLAEPHPPHLKLSDADLVRLKLRASTDGINISKPGHCIFTPPAVFNQQLADMLDVRMLFSCLTDADFLDTAAHFEGIAREKGPSLHASEALQALTDFMNNSVRTTSKADQSVLDARNSLWDMVTTAADRSPGLRWPGLLRQPEG
jgi:CRISPR-associated endonuclease/helicase Cas3